MGEMPMPAQTWPGAAASFLGMWVVMMVAMMLPSLVPMLWRYRQAVGRTGETRLGRLTALVGVGYFFVWTVFGMADRKSTRLNSSHVAISYAVFCLKKKTSRTP